MPDATSSLAPSCCLLTIFIPIYLAWRLRWSAYLLLSVRVIDAVTDPIMGAIADRTRSKYGRFRPWLLWIAFPYALFSILMFTTPEWSYNSKVIYAFVTYFLLSINLYRDQHSLLLARRR